MRLKYCLVTLESAMPGVLAPGTPLYHQAKAQLRVLDEIACRVRLERTTHRMYCLPHRTRINAYIMSQLDGSAQWPTYRRGAVDLQA